MGRKKKARPKHTPKQFQKKPKLREAVGLYTAEGRLFCLTWETNGITLNKLNRYGRDLIGNKPFASVEEVLRHLDRKGMKKSWDISTFRPLGVACKGQRP